MRFLLGVLDQLVNEAFVRFLFRVSDQLVSEDFVRFLCVKIGQLAE